MSEKIISLIKKCVGAFAVMGAGTAAVLILREHSTALDQAQQYLNLADAFTIPSVIMLMVGLLVWISTMGTFDTLGYALSKAKDAFIPSVYKHEQFYDYKVRKNKNRKKGYGFMFISGGIYFIPAIIFNILYNTCA